MPDAAEIVIFDLSGRTREQRPATLVQRIARISRGRGGAPTAQGTATEGGGAERKDSPEAALPMMNEHADSLARELEAEIMAALPPDPTLGVQAELRFHKGSLVMVGTVALLSWTGSIVLNTVMDELSAIIKIATQRVIAAALARFATAPVTMDCTVKPRPRSAGATASAPAPSAAAVASWQSGLTWRDILLIVLTLLVLLLLFNSVFDIRLRSPVAPTAVPPAAAPASP